MLQIKGEGARGAVGKSPMRLGHGRLHGGPGSQGSEDEVQILLITSWHDVLLRMPQLPKRACALAAEYRFH